MCCLKTGSHHVLALNSLQVPFPDPQWGWDGCLRSVGPGRVLLLWVRGQLPQKRWSEALARPLHWSCLARCWPREDCLLQQWDHVALSLLRQFKSHWRCTAILRTKSQLQLFMNFDYIIDNVHVALKLFEWHLKETAGNNLEMLLLPSCHPQISCTKSNPVNLDVSKQWTRGVLDLYTRICDSVSLIEKWFSRNILSKTKEKKKNMAHWSYEIHFKVERKISSLTHPLNSVNYSWMSYTH